MPRFWLTVMVVLIGLGLAAGPVAARTKPSSKKTVAEISAAELAAAEAQERAAVRASGASKVKKSQAQKPKPAKTATTAPAAKPKKVEAKPAAAKKPRQVVAKTDAGKPSGTTVESAKASKDRTGEQPVKTAKPVKAAEPKAKTAKPAAASEPKAKTEDKPRPESAEKAEPKKKVDRKNEAAPVAKSAQKSKKSTGAMGFSQSDEPIRITNKKRVELDDTAGTVTFTGKVKAVQGDTTLYCDKLIVHYAKVKKPGQKEEEAERVLTKIVALGHVKIVQPGQTSLGQEGVYEVAERRIIMKGRPKIIRGENTISGSKIIVYLDENRAVVEGGSSNVQAVIQPQGLDMSPNVGGPATGSGQGGMSVSGN